jgi:hypothetical protein
VIVFLLWCAVGGNERDGADYWALCGQGVYATREAAEARRSECCCGPHHIEERRPA